VLSFVIISGGVRPHSVARLLASLPRVDSVMREILIVGRYDGSLPAGLRLVPALDLANRAAICAMRNLGIDATSGDPVILLDDDIEFTPEWYSASTPAIESRRFDVAGCRCVTATGRRWCDWSWASRSDPSCPPRLLEYAETSPNAYVSGCFMMIQRRVFRTVRFDERRMNHERDDVDFCHRAVDAGFTLGIVPEATVIHHLEADGRSASDPASGSSPFAAGIALLRLERHAEAIERFRQAAASEGIRARYHEGVCLMELDRHHEAAAVLKGVVADAVSTDDLEGRRLHYSALYRLGVLSEREGRFHEAHRFYDATLIGFPEHRAAGEGSRRTAVLPTDAATGEA
jgi:glycosyltransferase involved in cell wall biosynthesis